MSIRWRETMRVALKELRDFALTALIFGGAQVLLSLPVWAILFRAHPVGLSMALSLVGFGSWLLAFLMSFSDRRRRRTMMPSMPDLYDPLENQTFVGQAQDRVRRFGCGFTLLFSSLIPLTIAFFLRLGADLRSGLTLTDIFPPVP